MFKINKALWITLIVYITLEIIIFCFLKFNVIKTNLANSIYLPIIVTPLFIVIIQWIIGKIRKSRVKTMKVMGLTPRDVELIHHYAGTKNVEAISYKELGEVWFRNSLVWYLVAMIAFSFGFILYAILEWV